MEISSGLWLATIVGFVGLVVIDFWGHVRRPHSPGLGESAVWSLFYVVLAFVFGAFIWWFYGRDHGLAYIAGYVTEKSLSIDNLFVFILILSTFRVPDDARQKVLLFGIVIALLLRGLFIALGDQAIEHFSWTFYVFGAFLIYTAVKLLTVDDDSTDDTDALNNPLVRIVRRVIPMTESYDGAALIARRGGRILATPMVLVITAIGATDVLFALDSIPAIYGLTQYAYIVFTANAFALLGLVQLYFLIGGLLDRLIYLSYGLAAILLFIGVKLVTEALNGNELGFINGGQPIHAVPEISTPMSLIIIVSILVVTTLASLLRGRAG